MRFVFSMMMMIVVFSPSNTIMLFATAFRMDEFYRSLLVGTQYRASGFDVKWIPDRCRV